MPSTREIRARIRSVRSIAQITKAMETVAASKMRRAQQQTLASRPYAERALEVLHSVARQAGTGEALHPLLQQRPVERIAIVLITADRGLAGGFNSNMIRAAIEFSKEQGKPTQWVSTGRKGRDFLVRYGFDVVAEFTGIPDPPRLFDILPIARVVIDDFLSGRVDAVYLGYTRFISTLTQRPHLQKLLPLEAVWETGHRTAIDYIFEPSAGAILSELLPRLTEREVYQAVLESIASEHSARMVAMRNAREAADELIGDLTLTYNKARQQAITMELLDIAGGSSALAEQ